MLSNLAFCVTRLKAAVGRVAAIPVFGAMFTPSVVTAHSGSKQGAFLTGRALFRARAGDRLSAPQSQC